MVKIVKNSPEWSEMVKMVKNGGADLQRAFRTGLSGRRAGRTKSKGPKGFQLEVGPCKLQTVFPIFYLSFLHMDIARQIVIICMTFSESYACQNKHKVSLNNQSVNIQYHSWAPDDLVKRMYSYQESLSNLQLFQWNRTFPLGVSDIVSLLKLSLGWDSTQQHVNN